MAAKSIDVEWNKKFFDNDSITHSLCDDTHTYPNVLLPAPAYRPFSLSLSHIHNVSHSHKPLARLVGLFFLFRLPLYCVLGHSDAHWRRELRERTREKERERETTHIYGFTADEVDKCVSFPSLKKKKYVHATALTQCRTKMYAKLRLNLCHRNKDISMTTYFSSAPNEQNEKKHERSSERKQQISCRVVCFVLLFIRLYGRAYYICV